MPVHDWSRVRSGKFHHFYNSWIYKLSDRLNDGILPPGFYAAGEQIVGDAEPDVIALQQRGESSASSPDWHSAAGVVALEKEPPRVSLTMEGDEALYLRKQDHIVIRAPDDDRIVALVEIVSRANKDSRRRMDQFLRKTAAALDAGFHVLVIDLHRPGAFDPQGMHGAIWEYLFGACPDAPPGRPLTLASYRAEPVPTAFVEPIAVGASLPDMPLFLDAQCYVNVPLEHSYMAMWEGYPAPWKQELTEY